MRSRIGSLPRAALAAFVSAAALLVGGACTTYDTYPAYGSRYGYGYGYGYPVYVDPLYAYDPYFYPGVWYSAYPRVWYGGSYVYLIDGAWYAHRDDRFVRYRDEPRELRDYRRHYREHGELPQEARRRVPRVEQVRAQRPPDRLPERVEGTRRDPAVRPTPQTPDELRVPQRAAPTGRVPGTRVPQTRPQPQTTPPPQTRPNIPQRPPPEARMPPRPTPSPSQRAPLPSRTAPSTPPIPQRAPPAGRVGPRR